MFSSDKATMKFDILVTPVRRQAFDATNGDLWLIFHLQQLHQKLLTDHGLEWFSLNLS